MRAIAKLMAVFGVLCSSTIGAFEPENRSLWYDEEDSAAFITAMKERGIPFRRDAEGGIWYPASKVQAVDEIAAVVRGRCSSATNYEDPRDAASFKDHLRRENIQFTTCRHFGKEYVKVDAAFEKRARQIEEIVDEESMKRGREERQRSRTGR